MPVNSIASVNNQADAEIGDVLIIPTASQVERSIASKTPRASSKMARSTPKSSATARVKLAKRPAARRVASAFTNRGRGH
jgi:hypothetical protein